MESVAVNARRIIKSARWDYDYNQAAYLEFEELFEQIETIGLQEICQQIITKGETPLWRGDKYVDEGILFIRSENVRESGLDLSRKTFIPESVHERMSRSRICPGDVLLAIVGATIGQVAVVPPEVQEANCNQAVAVIRPKEDFNPHYLKAVLQSSFGQTQIHRLSGGAARLNLDLWETRMLRIPLTSRSIQDRIAQMMQDAYATQREKLAEAEEVEASINEHVLQELGIDWSEIEDVKRFLVRSSDIRESRFDVRYRSPRADYALALLEESGHTVSALEKLIEVIHYGASVKNDYADAGIPFIRICNLKPNQIDAQNIVYFQGSMRDALGKAFVQTGDLLMSRSGSVGIVAVVTPEADGFAFGSFQIKFRLRDGSANPFFIAYFLNSPLGNAQIEQQKTGSIQMNITIGGIKALRVPLPSIKLQNRIVQEADAFRAEAQRLSTEAETVVVEAKARVERMILGQEEVS